MMFSMLMLLRVLSQAAPTIVTHTSRESISTSQWQIVDRAPADALITLHIGLAHDAEQASLLKGTAQHVSNPAHSQYRQFLSASELHNLTNPSSSNLDAVQQWLFDHHITSMLHGSVLEASSTISAVEDILDAAYNIYTDCASSVVRTSSYSLPADIDPLISFITPTTQFPAPASSRDHNSLLSQQTHAHFPAKRDDPSNPCAGTFTTPSCLKSHYNITRIPSPNRTTFAIYATEASLFHPGDLHTFLDRYNTPAAAANAAYEVIGSGDPANGLPGIGSTFETALDTQTAMGTAWPANGVLFDLGGVFGPHAGGVYDPFVTFLRQLITNETVPSVVSFSESMPEDTVDPAYARSLCALMMQVGLRGVSLLFSSGDNGPNGDQPTGEHVAVFEPEFPASCPWVTAVGGTTKPGAETAATRETMGGGGLGYYASGGGFSNLFARPSWQDGVVDRYVKEYVPGNYSGVSGFNADGRGVPDVAALSTSFPVVVAGITVPVGGTSASTPFWAAVVALLNDYEASRGRPPLGFLNPWLYSISDKGTGLRDITTGGNSAGACFLLAGCKLEETLGYDVTEGWDPATGLGVPDVGALMRVLP